MPSPTQAIPPGGPGFAEGTMPGTGSVGGRAAAPTADYAVATKT